MKKVVLAMVLICLVLVLSGCGCKHETTNLINAKDATCTTDGYTGDTVCAKCSEVIIKGEVISAKGHIASEPMGAQEATCSREGFTGIVYCALCSEKITDGDVIPMLAHVADPELYGAREPRCDYEGYTGDTHCYNCYMLMEEGEAIPVIEHTPRAELYGVREASCERDGYTGDLYCDVCGDLLEEGEVIPMVEHIPNAERSYAREATCTREGYTGELYCSVCNRWLEDGETIPVTEHALGEPLNAIEVTCLADGYSGDCVCSTCERTIKGEVIPKLEHSYDADNTCTVCGYKVAGLYIDGQLQFTWEELKNNAYVELDEKNRMRSIVKSLYGTLVVEEGVTMYYDDMFKASALNVVYLPASVDHLDSAMFADNPALEAVYWFGNGAGGVDSYCFSGCTGLKTVVLSSGVTGIGHYAFDGCTSLESLVVPDSVNYIGYDAFRNCTALKDINMPASLRHIDDEAFMNCSALTTLVLPEGFETLDENVLNGTAITEFVGPSTMKWFGRQYNAALVNVDLSDTAITYFDGSTFADCVKLESVKLPRGLTSMYDTEFKNCPALKAIELPDSLTTLGDGWSADMSSNVSVTYVVWPVFLSDGTFLSTLPNLETIYYRGSELQWDLSVSKDLFPNATVVFNYEPEA